MSPLRRSQDRKNERAENAEDGAAGADGGTAREDCAGDGGDGAGREVDQCEAARAEHRFVQRAELPQREGVRREVKKIRVEEHAGDRAPVFVIRDQRSIDRAEAIEQLVGVEETGNVDREDQDQEHHCHRRIFESQESPHYFSIETETRRMSRWASRGNVSLSRMYSAANGGRMRRYFPSSAASAIARATRSGFTA